MWSKAVERGAGPRDAGWAEGRAGAGGGVCDVDRAGAGNREPPTAQALRNRPSLKPNPTQLLHSVVPALRSRPAR